MNRGRIIFTGLALLVICTELRAALPADWQRQQMFQVGAPGLVKLSLPVETLNSARPGLEDLRVVDDAGKELAYLVEHPTPVPKVVRGAKGFQTSLYPTMTVATIETGLAQPMDGITLQTPGENFIKSVQVEGTADGRNYHMLVQAQPIFRQANGASQLHIALPAGVYTWLRVTVDDQRSLPIPFTGATVYAASAEAAPDEAVPVSISERVENPGETRLTLNLGAANLVLSELEMETPEPLFTRQVTLAVPRISESAIREQTIGQGVIYRVAVEGQAASSNLTVAVETQTGGPELLLLIRN